MGDGHNAAARAITEAILARWPGCRVEQVDTMEIVGHRFAVVCRTAYAYQLTKFPWAYEFFYEVIDRHSGVVDVSRVSIGRMFAGAVRREIERVRPDVVLSTYPMASAALAWLHRRGRLRIPGITFVLAFHVHALWVYPEVDLQFVIHESLVKDVRRAGVAAPVAVSAPPVRRAFGRSDGPAARDRLGIPAPAYVALVTGGGLGIGRVEEAIRAILGGADPAGGGDGRRVQVIAVCGRNEQLRRRLEALRGWEDRLLVLGYVETMPELMAASDIVVTNGAGVTCLEALASGRPVIAFDPLAGHGKASAEIMRREGLALVCRGPAELRDAVGRLASDQALAARMSAAARAYVRGKDLRVDMDRVARLMGAVAGVVGPNGRAGRA